MRRECEEMKRRNSRDKKRVEKRETRQDIEE
jgi:hypothetical protein